MADEIRKTSSLLSVSVHTMGNGAGLAALLKMLADDPILINSLLGKPVEVIIREARPFPDEPYVSNF